MEYQILLVKFDSQSTLTPLFTQLFLSFQESPGIGDRTKRKRKFHSVETRLEVDASSYIYMCVYPFFSSSPLLLSIEPLASKTQQRSSQL